MDLPPDYDDLLAEAEGNGSVSGKSCITAPSFASSDLPNSPDIIILDSPTKPSHAPSNVRGNERGSASNPMLIDGDDDDDKDDDGDDGGTDDGRSAGSTHVRGQTAANPPARVPLGPFDDGLWGGWTPGQPHPCLDGLEDDFPPSYGSHTLTPVESLRLDEKIQFEDVPMSVPDANADGRKTFTNFMTSVALHRLHDKNSVFPPEFSQRIADANAQSNVDELKRIAIELSPLNQFGIAGVSFVIYPGTLPELVEFINRTVASLMDIPPSIIPFHEEIVTDLQMIASYTPFVLADVSERLFRVFNGGCANPITLDLHRIFEAIRSSVGIVNGFGGSLRLEEMFLISSREFGEAVRDRIIRLDAPPFSLTEIMALLYKMCPDEVNAAGLPVFAVNSVHGIFAMNNDVFSTNASMASFTASLDVIEPAEDTIIRYLDHSSLLSWRYFCETIARDYPMRIMHDAKFMSQLAADFTRVQSQCVGSSDISVYVMLDALREAYLAHVRGASHVFFNFFADSTRIQAATHVLGGPSTLLCEMVKGPMGAGKSYLNGCHMWQVQQHVLDRIVAGGDINSHVLYIFVGPTITTLTGARADMEATFEHRIEEWMNVNEALLTDDVQKRLMSVLPLDQYEHNKGTLAQRLGPVFVSYSDIKPAAPRHQGDDDGGGDVDEEELSSRHRDMWANPRSIALRSTPHALSRVLKGNRLCPTPRRVLLFMDEMLADMSLMFTGKPTVSKPFYSPTLHFTQWINSLRIEFQHPDLIRYFACACAQHSTNHMKISPPTLDEDGSPTALDGSRITPEFMEYLTQGRKPMRIATIGVRPTPFLPDGRMSVCNMYPCAFKSLKDIFLFMLSVCLMGSRLNGNIPEPMESVARVTTICTTRRSARMLMALLHVILGNDIEMLPSVTGVSSFIITGRNPDKASAKLEASRPCELFASEMCSIFATFNGIPPMNQCVTNILTPAAKCGLNCTIKVDPDGKYKVKMPGGAVKIFDRVESTTIVDINGLTLSQGSAAQLACRQRNADTLLLLNLHKVRRYAGPSFCRDQLSRDPGPNIPRAREFNDDGTRCSISTETLSLLTTPSSIARPRNEINPTNPTKRVSFTADSINAKQTTSTLMFPDYGDDDDIDDDDGDENGDENGGGEGGQTEDHRRAVGNARRMTKRTRQTFAVRGSNLDPLLGRIIQGLSNGSKKRDSLVSVMVELVHLGNFKPCPAVVCESSSDFGKVLSLATKADTRSIIMRTYMSKIIEAAQKCIEYFAQTYTSASDFEALATEWSERCVERIQRFVDNDHLFESWKLRAIDIISNGISYSLRAVSNIQPSDIKTAARTWAFGDTMISAETLIEIQKNNGIDIAVLLVMDTMKHVKLGVADPNFDITLSAIKETILSITVSRMTQCSVTESVYGITDLKTDRHFIQCALMYLFVKSLEPGVFPIRIAFPEGCAGFDDFLNLLDEQNQPSVMVRMCVGPSQFRNMSIIHFLRLVLTKNRQTSETPPDPNKHLLKVIKRAVHRATSAVVGQKWKRASRMGFLLGFEAIRPINLSVEDAQQMQHVVRGRSKHRSMIRDFKNAMGPPQGVAADLWPMTPAFQEWMKSIPRDEISKILTKNMCRHHIYNNIADFVEEEGHRDFTQKMLYPSIRSPRFGRVEEETTHEIIESTKVQIETRIAVSAAKIVAILKKHEDEAATQLISHLSNGGGDGGSDGGGDGGSDGGSDGNSVEQRLAERQRAVQEGVSALLEGRGDAEILEFDTDILSISTSGPESDEDGDED